ncbi:MAG: dephospho-CoA kinase, partial [Acidimicrobiales bacterium]
HPVIGTVVSERLAALADEEVVVLDIPLLNQLTVELYRPGAVIVVDVPEDVAVSRLVAHRGFGEDDARARVAAQMGRDERRGLLDLVPAGRLVDNSGDRETLDAAVDQAWAWLRALADASTGTAGT